MTEFKKLTERIGEIGASVKQKGKAGVLAALGISAAVPGLEAADLYAKPSAGVNLVIDFDKNIHIGGHARRKPPCPPNPSAHPATPSTPPSS